MTLVLHNATIAPMNEVMPARQTLLEGYDIIIENDVISAIHKSRSANTYHSDDVIALDGKLVTPGLIDCHTHIVFGGNRAHEWEQRLNGVSYEDIANNGGGINTTMVATREESFDTLYSKASARLKALMSEGVTTLESKSGYGLNLETERKQLLVSQKLATNHAVTVKRTLLSAHTLPPEFKGNPDRYIDVVCDEIMPTLHAEGLVDAVDAFCECVGFNIEQTERVYAKAHSLGIPVKGHTEQLSNLGGSALVAKYHGLSADHVEYIDEAGIVAMKKGGTVATILPLAFYFLKETQQPPIDLLHKHGVPIAIATDFNPGTAPMASMRLAMNMACVQFNLTPAEVWHGVTKNAATALGLGSTHGQIKVGYVADLCVWDAQRPVDIIYELGHNPLKLRIFKGELS